MATVALVGTGIATGLLYDAAFDAERSRLVELVRSQVSLIEAVAKFDAEFSEDDHDGGSSGATVSQIQAAHGEYRGFRSTGKFHLARRNGDRLEYLLKHQQKGFGGAVVPAASMELDAAMAHALSGETGTMVTLGHNGEQILAAYEPIPSLDLGLVAKVSVSEIRAPFIKAATISGAVTLILIFLGALFVHRVNDSLIQRLHKSVADLNTAQRIAKIGHWDWDIQTGSLHWTDEIYRIFGQEPRAFAASYDAFLETIHPDDRASVVEAVDRTVKEGARYDIEHRVVQPDGQVRMVHEQGEVTRDRDGTPIHMTGTVHDITERKQAEELGQRFGRILDSSLNEIYVFDAGTRRFVQVNEGARRNLGYDMDELRAMTAWDIEPAIDETRFQEMVAPLRDGETEALRFETAHQRKNGSEYPVEVHLQLFTDESPAVFVAIILDITIRKLAENQVRMFNQDLERRVEARTSEFEDANNSPQETLAHLSQTQEQLVEAEKMASLGGLVMEHDHAGLEVARYVREELGNKSIRIVLRTGQPGQAPERKIIADYDINDYKEKTYLTFEKLYTLMYSCLRSYRDIIVIENNKRGLEKVIDASASIFETHSLERFTHGVMEQLTSLLMLDRDAVYCKTSGLAAHCADDADLEIVAGTGQFADAVGKDLREIAAPRTLADLQDAIAKRGNLFRENRYTGYFSGSSGTADLFHVTGIGSLTEIDRNLIELFSKNVGIAFKNLHFNKEIEDTQKEIVHRLGEAVETRSKETGNHIRRVAEYSKLLALGSGLDSGVAAIIRLASPLHDIGKIGIPDAILNKPGKHTPEEWEIMKTHAQLGHDMLEGSERPILLAGAIIALDHHEKWSGEGYPNGKQGEDIHIYGRITALADVFDALGGDRCYKKAWPLGKILDLLREERGRHFDPDLVDSFFERLDAFLAIREAYPDRAGQAAA